MSRFKLGTKFTVFAGCALGLSMTLSAGCIPHPLKPVELEKGSEVEDQLQLTVNKDVDILFVIDNSGSMGEEQAILANNFGAFIQVLEGEDVEANYRLGVTTSDNGNPWCGQTTPEGGKLVLSSCKDRISDFLFNNGEVDVQDLACNDVCDLDSAALEITPTATELDPNEVQRPWLENIEGAKNIPPGTSTEDAFKCFGPQGINGCGFESQLESMYLSLIRAQNSAEDSYGFLRASAILAVVFVTDEADCSYNKDWSEIFDADGNKVFWSDPTSPFPSSAVCWNAGVECMGDSSGYDSCEPMNYDVNGNAQASDADAVLHPMNRYSGLLAGLEVDKQQLNPDQEVITALIGGVSNQGEVFYSDSLIDPNFQDSFGIGPGCEAVNPITNDPIQAVPPVRLRTIIDQFTPGNMFSICEQDYSAALEAIAAKIRDQIQPACYSKCVKDTDAATELVDPECTVEEAIPGAGGSETLDECLTDANGYVLSGTDYTMPADGVNVCYALLTDPNMSTGSTGDDMSEVCTDQNFNLEFKIARRPGFPAAGGTSISATCSLADFPEVTCPGIGG